MAVLALAACTPTTIAGLGADAAYTTSESRTVDEVVDDNSLKLALNRDLAAADLGLFKDVSTVIYRRKIYLLGIVNDVARKRRAGAIAAGLDGAEGVVNLLQVSDEGGVGSSIRDTVLETRIQSALLFDSDVSSANYRIRSILGTVYVIGAASGRDELDRVLATVRSYEGVRDVRTFVEVR